MFLTSQMQIIDDMFMLLMKRSQTVNQFAFQHLIPDNIWSFRNEINANTSSLGQHTAEDA